MSEHTTIDALSRSGVLELGDGYRTKKSELRSDGYRIIRVADVKDGQISLDSPDFVSTEFERQIKSKIATAGDVLLTTKGTVGRVAIVPEDVSQAVYSPQLCWFRVKNPTKLSNRYISYWLQSPEFTAQASYMQGNTDMAPYISLSDLRRSKLSLPPLPEQQAIAEVLGALDDKIAANTRLAATADSFMAAKLASVQTTTHSLDSVAEFHNRRRIPLSSPERDSRPGTVPYYGATGVFGYVDTAIFDTELVLIGEDGSVVNPDGTPVAQYVWGPAWVNNHAHVLTGLTISTELLYQVVRMADVAALVTGAVQPKINMKNLKQLELRIPSSGSLDAIEVEIKTLTATRRSLLTENRTLAVTRDALLPKLMSGALRVKDAVRIAEDAGA